MTPAARLRQLLQGPHMLVAPGAYDAISALTIQQAGFELAYMTGVGYGRRAGLS